MRKTYLLDTNIVSEFSKAKPNPQVMELYELRKDFCAISAVTWQELIYGLERMPEGKRKSTISSFINNLGQNTEIIPYDENSAQICGTFLGTFSNKGKPLPFGDTQIAATAAANGMILVTHNTQDFKEVAERSFLKLEDWFSE